jgi:hypothetical protein
MQAVSRILNLFSVAIALAIPAHALAHEQLSKVHFRTTQQSFSSENYYLLWQGRIWTRANEEVTGKHEPWRLFEGHGVPFGKNVKQFGPNNHVIAFAQEGTMIMAVSDTGRMYKWQPTFKKNTVWEEKFGSPFSTDLWLPESRDFAFSLSLAEGSIKDDPTRLTPMKDIVRYYEDPAGQTIKFGITGTVYVLMKDGREIRFWDTGLPTAFSRGFVTPEHGNFVATQIAASGSTVLVADETGQIYTRMYDYEIATACPGLHFTYNREEALRGKSKGLQEVFAATRLLPLPDWMAHDKVPLQGDAAVTRKISIHMTGQGNAAREIRIQGRLDKERYGYYFKPIFAQQWQFRETGETFEDQAINQIYAARSMREESRARDFGGQLHQTLAPGLSVWLVGFQPFDLRSILRVKTPGGTVFDLILHTVDAWAPTEQQKFSPELVGLTSGEAKLLLGTLEIPPSVKNSPDPEIRSVVARYFKRFDLDTFAFEVTASNKFVKLETPPYRRHKGGYLNVRVVAPVSARLERVGRLTAEELLTGYSALTTMPQLVIEDFEFATRADAPRLKKAIELNREMLKRIKDINRAQKKGALGAGLQNLLGAVIWDALFMPVAEVAGVSAYLPLGSNLLQGTGRPLERYAQLNLEEAFSNNQDFAENKRLLEGRIAEYEEVYRKVR